MKILIIEDEKLLADSIGALLTKNGFSVEIVYDGESGAQYAELGIYDLLILDVMLPGKNGYDLARQVRKDHLGVPILMLTAKSELEDRITGLDSGADYYLTKPFDTRELLERLSTSRREFNATAFAELDRNLSDEEREEWNAIYASFSSRSLLRNTVIGLETIPFPTDENMEQALTCMVVMRHLVKVLIPLPLFWLEPTGINPNSVIGAEIDYIIIGGDREGECAVAARSLALEQQRWHALNVQHITEGDVVSASVLACGPTRITVTACGFDVTMGQQAMSYTYLADMREEYHAGQQLQAKVLSVGEDMLALSVRDVGTDPYLNAELRHSVGSSRIGTISSKYAGGVFCRLTDGCTVVCRYAQQFSDDEFRVGDRVVVQIRSFVDEKRWLRGKIRGKL